MSRKRGRAGGAGARPVKVGETVRQVLSSMLADGSIKDPRVSAAMATITEVTMSPDLAYAKVYVSVFTDDPAVSKTVLAGLASAAGTIQRTLGRQLATRNTPRLTFELDETIARGARINAVLQALSLERGDADPVATTDAADPVATTDAADPVATTDAADPAATTDAADPVATTDAADPVATTDAADPPPDPSEP